MRQAASLPEIFSLCIGNSDCAIDWLAQSQAFAASYLLPPALWIGDKVAGPAIVAVVFAGLTNYHLEKRRSRRDTIGKLCDQIRNDLSDLQEKVTEYYARDYDIEKDPPIEVQIVTLDREITGAFRMYAEHAKNLSKLQGLEAFLDLFSISVMSETTFQTKERTTDIDQQRLAIDVISRLRAALTESRLKSITKIQ